MYTVNMHMYVHTYKLHKCTVHAYVYIDINIRMEYTTHIQVHKYKTATVLSDEIFTTPRESEAQCIQHALTRIYNATVPDLGLELYNDIVIQPGKTKDEGVVRTINI